MAELVYTAITSLDGYVADAGGRFDWAAPDEEVHAFVNDLERGAGTYLYGRRMWETMRFWEQDSPEIDSSPISRDYAEIWRAADKVVFSSTLAGVDGREDAAGAAVRAGRGPPLEARRIRPAQRRRAGARGRGPRRRARRRAPLDRRAGARRRAAPGGCPTGSGASSSSWTTAGSPRGRRTAATASSAERYC